MEQAGKVVLVIGLVIAGLGFALWLAGKAGFRGFPGDIHYKSDGFELYFPIVTCIVISIALTAIFWLWTWIRGE